MLAHISTINIIDSFPFMIFQKGLSFLARRYGFLMATNTTSICRMLRCVPFPLLINSSTAFRQKSSS